MQHSLEKQQLKETIATGSKSFRWASLFLSPKMQRGAYILYRWCRYCDDQIDDAKDLKLASQRLVILHEQTQKALEFKDSQVPNAFHGLYELGSEYQIPHSRFFELLEGFRMDVLGSDIQSETDLEKYCYHVAGVVGLLMSPILGVTDQMALSYADSLGRAMQLTNICRDIKEDYHNGRIYIPYHWLQKEKLTAENLLNSAQREELWNITTQLLDLADLKYQQGRKGLCFLPFRAGLSISVASHLYQNIGHKLRKQGPQGIEQRTVLNSFEKIMATIDGIADFIFITMIKFPQKMKKVWVQND